MNQADFFHNNMYLYDGHLRTHSTEKTRHILINANFQSFPALTEHCISKLHK